ncbi:MAG TPA: DNA replication/repair protein RecF [Acholeplasmataceae bacterium]|nr:DNA replication/repair protein RecF [Acholeplasmataceae bacterium]
MIYLKELKLTNFRCFSNLDLKFSDKVNILVGNNAVGKTSIVEAVHCLGILKSHRTNNDQQLIKVGSDYGVVKGKFKESEKTNEIIFSITSKGKKIVFNNKAYNNLSEYIGYLSVVMFCPEDMELVKGSPSARRKFLDSNISQINSLYLQSSINYRKILKERNEVLKQIAEEVSKDYNLLDVYTKTLVKEAKNIIKARNEFINLINPHIEKIAKVISNDKELVKLKYMPSVEYEKIEEVFKTNLKNDLFYKTTTKGPHRDDFEIELNGVNIANFGSQGQQRTAVLALKLALAEVISKNNSNLIVILDDVFSELDLNRQNQIISLLNNSKQIFITTTSVENLSEKILNDSFVIHVNKESEASGESRAKE